ncbi:restriction endonuclease subunit S [Halanaerobium saccharolyticum]|uniref:restriction endonuclease subunit S n=1 Tax=Halanaerobium saccharolyticum TaxID=43595 RepID=UPI003FCE46F0
MLLKEIFKLNQGHQITDEEIYNNPGPYPVLTGNNEIKGYWDKKIIEKDDLPCLTYPTKGNAGVLFIQNEIFDANNTAVLIPKNDYRDKILLEWFKYKLPSIFLKVMTSKRGVSYLNKNIVKKIDLDLPPLEKQRLEIKQFRKLDQIKNELIKYRNKLEKTISKNIIMNLDENEEMVLGECFKYISRNDSLTQEGVYNNLSKSQNSNKNVEVLSGSSSDVFYGKIDFNKSDIHLLENRQCLHVITRGIAGKLKFLSKGTYATNTNAYLLYIPKEKWEDLNISNEKEEKIYLKFMKIILQPLLYKEVSKSDLGVLAISYAMKDVVVPKLKYNKKMDSVINYLNKLQKYFEIIENNLDKVNKLMDKKIVD